MVGWILLAATVMFMAFSLRCMVRISDLQKILSGMEPIFAQALQRADQDMEWLHLLIDKTSIERLIMEWTRMKDFCQFLYIVSAYATFWVLFVGWFAENPGWIMVTGIWC